MGFRHKTGFLVLRDPDGEALAYGDWKQVVKPDGLVEDDLQSQFKQKCGELSLSPT